MQPQHKPVLVPSIPSTLTPLSAEKCKYTIIQIQNPQHRQKLQKFITARGKVKNKSSLCRFYLRGICIMKPQYCKFAHSIKQLTLDCDDALFYMTLSDKQRKKREFVEKKEFNQTALFILKQVPYYVLYQFQFGDKYQNSKLAVHSLETISTDRSIRIRIRQIMHRQCWDGFLNFLQQKFPFTNFPISFISFWYANFGFDKPQTRCKFGDFLKYSMYVRKYIQADIIFPPNTQPSIYLINSLRKQTVLQQNVQFIHETCMKQKQKQGKQKMEQFLEKALPEQLSKKYICRYFMAGNCQQSQQKCLYAHSIQELSKFYDLKQEFPVQYRQPVMPIQVRMNFTSLYNATRKYPEYSEYTLQDINLNSTIRNQLRDKVHHELFGNFLKYLQQILPKPQPLPGTDFIPFSVPLKQLQKYYQAAGFNHTNQNKFQHLQSSLWSLGYYMQDVVGKDEATLQKKKWTVVYKIPPIQYLDKVYQSVIKTCVQNQIATLGINGTLLQSALRRVIYSYHKADQVLPLHVYLRHKNISFQDAVCGFCSKEDTDRIFFQSGQENIKKMSQILRKYLKKNKNYFTKIDDIQLHIRQQKKNQINTNHLLNLRSAIQTILIQMGKQIFFFPFDNNAYLIDPALFPLYKKTVLQNYQKQQAEDQNYQQFIAKCNQQERGDWLNRRIVVVDGFKELQYAKKYLQICGLLGVDLQGRLRVGGYVDLIQISAVKRNTNKEIVHKQIFIFDIFAMNNKKNTKSQLQNEEKEQQQNQTKVEQVTQIQKENENQKLCNEAVDFLRSLLQSPKVTKILHDCRQDSIALKHILHINISNVFDTSGFDIYLIQKNLYAQIGESITHQSILRRIYEVKVSGLNSILDTYKAPNGINIWKQSMKKRFGDSNSRPYFQQRPMDEQFLQYSARDVEDLIEVYQNMIQGDEHGIARFIGNLYSSC